MNMHAFATDRFRPIQYLGNKTRLLDEIADAVASVVEPGRPVADLFSGTAVVGRRLAWRNPVVAVDVQTYAAVLGRAMLGTGAQDLAGFDEEAFLLRADAADNALTDAFAPMLAGEARAMAALGRGNPDPAANLIEGGSPLSRAAAGRAHGLPAKVTQMLDGEAGLPDATATLAFGGVYFSFAQAIRLDALHHAADTEPAGRREVLVGAMLGVASEVVNTVGKQFAQPVRLLDGAGRPKPLLMERTLRDRGLDARRRFIEVLARWRDALPRQAGHRNRVVQGDVDAFLRSEADWGAAYADPPYTIDHYSRFYHVLETLVRRDRPALSRMNRNGVPTVMRGLYRDDRFQSDFCVPSKAPAAFGSLFEGVAAKGAALVLSYSGHADAAAQRPRTLPVEHLVALARRSFRSVEVTEPGFEGHRKLNASSRNASTERGSERLLVCRS